MKHIQQSENEHHWPRHNVPTVECRKRDLVLRITDWTGDREEPGYDVECYIGGVYDWHESKCCTVFEYGTKAAAKVAAVAFAQAKIAELL